MNIRFHHRAEGSVHELMTLDGSQAGKGLRDDTYAEMTPAIAGTGMAYVQVAVVDDLDDARAQRLGQ